MKLLQELIAVDPDGDTPIYLQITNAFVHHICNGRLRKGLKLPGSRELAGMLHINRMTVVAAYDELQAQGWIEMLPRKGTFIKHDLPLLVVQKITEDPGTFKIPEQTWFSFDEKRIVPIPLSDFPDPQKLIFNDGFPDIRLAPLEELMRSMRSLSMRVTSRKYFGYGGSQGTALLRETLADFLSDTRGLPINPDNILITRGSQMGIYLATNLLIRQGDDVIVSEPNYVGANQTFQQVGAKLNRVPVDADGMDIDAVEQHCKKKKIRFVYVISHHHHPTTVTLTPERRIRLLELALKYKFAIIEDDYDYDFHYASKPMMPIASLDRHGCVIYIGTLTKTLAPSIRVGFMVAPARFIRFATHLRKAIDTKGDSLLENAIAELYKDGTIGRHIKKSVKLYRERRDHFCQLLQQEIGAHVSFKIPDGGMSVWVNFHGTDLQLLSQRAYEKGLIINDGSEYNMRDVVSNSIRMGFASLNLEEQKKAVAILKECL